MRMKGVGQFLGNWPNDECTAACASVACYRSRVTAPVSTPPALEVIVTEFGGGILVNTSANTPFGAAQGAAQIVGPIRPEYGNFVAGLMMSSVAVSDTLGVKSNTVTSRRASVVR